MKSPTITLKVVGTEVPIQLNEPMLSAELKEFIMETVFLAIDEYIAKMGHKGVKVDDPILRLPEVKAMTGLSGSTIYMRIAAGEFPKQMSLGGRSVGWKRSQILSWLTSVNRSDS